MAVQSKEDSVAPDALFIAGQGEIGELVINRSRQFGFKSVPDENSGRRTGLCLFNPERMVRPQNDCIAAVQTECNSSVVPVTLALHLYRAECGRIDVDLKLLDRGDENVPAVGLTTENGRKQAHHCRPSDRRSLMIPCAVPRDPHSRMATMLRIPSLHWRRSALVDQPLKLSKADSLKFDRRPAFGH